MSAPAHTPPDGYGDRVSLQRFLTALTEAGVWHRVRGDHVDFRCPLPDHPDTDASGSADWKPADGRKPGRMLLKCHRCGQDRTGEILAELGLRASDLYDDPPARPAGARSGLPRPARPAAAPASQRATSRPDKSAAPRRVEMTSTVRLFTEADGTERFRLTRYDPVGDHAEARKEFKWEHRGPGETRWSLGKECKGYCYRCRVSFDPAETTTCPSCGQRRVCSACEHDDKPSVQLYRLPQVFEAVGAGKRIWLCEGGKNADDLAGYLPAGEVATTAPDGSKGAWTSDHTAALSGAAVTIIADRDQNGYEYAGRVAKALRAADCVVRVVRTPIEEQGADASDHLAAGLGLDAFEDGAPETWIKADTSPRAAAPAPDSGASVTSLADRTARQEQGDAARGKKVRKSRGDDDGGGGNRGARLLAMALEEYEPVWATTGEHYLIPRNGPRVARRLTEGRRSFIAELCTNFHDRCGEIAESNHRSNVLLMLRGYAERTDPIELGNRVASYKDSILLDLGDESGRVVEVTAKGWKVLPESPVLFGRTARTGSLPVPSREGDVSELWDLVNVRAADRPLAEAELIGRYFPNMSHPLLALSGEAGTGKTSAAETLTQLVDPSPAPVISLPTDQKDWAVQVGQAHSLVIDNVASLQQWQSDALCMSVTGGKTQFRQLFTDGGLVSFGGQQCITLTSIDMGSQKADLTTRMLPVELERFDRGRRLSEQALKARREEARPRLLGAVLDRVSAVMATLPRVDELDLDLPRLSDFARLCKALDLLDGGSADRYGDYLRLLGQQAESIADEDEVSAALITWMRERAKRGNPSWEGTSTELHAELNRATLYRSRYWPETAVSFGKRLSTVVAPLREAGVDVSKPPRSSKRRAWRIVLKDSPVAEPGEPTSSLPRELSFEPVDQPVVAPAAAVPSEAPIPPSPCEVCTEPGPWCGRGAIGDEPEPCVLCGEATVVRSECGAPRHADCQGGGISSSQTPIQPPPAPVTEQLQPSPKSTQRPARSIRPTAADGKEQDGVSHADELRHFASAIRNRGIDPDPDAVRDGLDRFHEATDGLRMVSYPGEVGVALYARLVGQHAAMKVPVQLECPEVEQISSKLRLFRDHLIPGATIEDEVNYHVTGCDVNGQFLAAAGSVELGDGDPMMVENPRSVDGLIGQPGYFQLAAPIDTRHSAFGRLKKGEWITTQSAKYLAANRDIDLPVMKAVVWDSKSRGRRLSAWAGRMRTARDRLTNADPADLGSSYALMVVKAIYTAFLGGMLRSEKRNKTGTMRPDWSDQVVTLANANMWRALDKITDSRCELLGVRRDSAWFLAKVEHGLIAPTGLTFTDQLGKWRIEPDRSGTLTEEMWAAYQAGSAERFLQALIVSARSSAIEIEGGH